MAVTIEAERKHFLRVEMAVSDAVCTRLLEDGGDVGGGLYGR